MSSEGGSCCRKTITLQLAFERTSSVASPADPSVARLWFHSRLPYCNLLGYIRRNQGQGGRIQIPNGSLGLNCATEGAHCAVTSDPKSLRFYPVSLVSQAFLLLNPWDSLRLTSAHSLCHLSAGVLWRRRPPSSHRLWSTLKSRLVIVLSS